MQNLKNVQVQFLCQVKFLVYIYYTLAHTYYIYTIILNLNNNQTGFELAYRTHPVLYLKAGCNASISLDNILYAL